MHMYIVRIITFVRTMLSMFGSRARVWLNNSCWFNSVSELEKDDAVYSDSLDNVCAVNWSRLWRSAGDLYHSLRYSHSPFLKKEHTAARPRRLAVRKRYELSFLCRISSLHQLMMCLHAGGDAGDAAMLAAVRSQSTMRFSAIVLFLLPFFSQIRSCYVYRLCCSLPYGRRPYLHGCGGPGPGGSAAWA
ncbi:hypothetical protein F3J29_03635 [Enterobacter sp. Cy-643]|nr:hypothetical protein [Enterobacter sp. Cy-643]